MGEHRVRAVLLVQASKTRPASVVLIFAIGGEDVFVEASQLFNGNGIDREAGVSNAWLPPVEALMKAGATDDVSISAGSGLFGDLAEVAGGEGDVVVGDDDHVCLSRIGSQHAFIPALAYTTVASVRVVDYRRILGDTVA